MSGAAPHEAVGGMALFAVASGEAVTAWALSAIAAELYPGVPTLAEDRVNYRFINGFVDVGDLPCREALWSEIKSRQVELQTGWQVESVNLPGFNRRLDFSGFWHRPTRLARWCRTTLVPPASGTYQFKLATCGGVHIWVDGVLAAKFEPFRRNSEHAINIELPLKAEGSEVVMLSEELAERDANWYVELVSLGSEILMVGVLADVSETDLKTLMTLAASVHSPAEFYCQGPITLVFSEPAPERVLVTARVQQSVHMRHKPPLYSVRAELPAGAESLEIGGIQALPDGYHALDLTFEVGDTRLDRQIAFALLRETVPALRASGLAARKREALAFAATYGELRIGRALASLATGNAVNAHTEAIILDTLSAIDERRDCSDFVMVPLLWLYGEYAGALDPVLANRIKSSVLGYRYWVDEPGNDVMWFWSENHVLCFHVSQYLAGRLFPHETFAASDRKGALQAELAAERLGKWFGSVEAHGLAEWNSAAYYPIDFIGLLALYHWADGEIRTRAREQLDRLFTMIALHTLGGVAAGTQGRAYDKELRAGPLTELAPFATIAFGHGWLNDGVAALPMLAASDYEPPPGLARYAAPPEGRAYIAHYVQGYGQAARLALYKSAAVQLSASVDGVPGHQGHQQHLIDIRFAGHPFARAWINHPGDDDPWGHQRPSYWAGNGVMPRVGQHGDAAMMIFDLGETARVDFTHAYVPADGFDERYLENNWLVLRSKRGFAALSASVPIESVTSGPGDGREFRAYGKRVAWCVLVGELADDAGLDVVRKMLSGAALAFDESAMTAELIRAERPTLVLDYAAGLFVDGSHFDFPNPNLDPLVNETSASILC